VHAARQGGCEAACARCWCGVTCGLHPASDWCGCCSSIGSVPCVRPAARHPSSIAPAPHAPVTMLHASVVRAGCAWPRVHARARAPSAPPASASCCLVGRRMMMAASVRACLTGCCGRLAAQVQRVERLLVNTKLTQRQPGACCGHVRRGDQTNCAAACRTLGCLSFIHGKNTRGFATLNQPSASSFWPFARLSAQSNHTSVCG
jgi:hypothetical protein